MKLKVKFIGIRNYIKVRLVVYGNRLNAHYGTDNYQFKLDSMSSYKCGSSRVFDGIQASLILKIQIYCIQVLREYFQIRMHH